MLCLLLTLLQPLLGKTQCGVICLYFCCCRLMSPGCGDCGGLGMGLVGVPGARWAAGTCSVPHLYKEVSGVCPTERLQRDPAASPEGWGQAGGPTGDGDSDIKAKFGFFLFFLSFFNDGYFYCDLTTCFNDTCSLFSNTLGTRNKVHKESLFGCCGCAPLFFPALIP